MGVELCFVFDGKEFVDKVIIMDVLLFGYDYKLCFDILLVKKDVLIGNGIVFVIGDRGFCVLLWEFSNRYIIIVVIGNGY